MGMDTALYMRPPPLGTVDINVEFAADDGHSVIFSGQLAGRLAACRASARLETARAGTSPAPDITVTVAPFRAWRGSRLIVAEKPTRAAMEPCRRQSGRAARKVGAEHNKKEAVGGCFR